MELEDLRGREKQLLVELKRRGDAARGVVASKDREIKQLQQAIRESGGTVPPPPPPISSTSGGLSLLAPLDCVDSGQEEKGQVSKVVTATTSSVNLCPLCCRFLLFIATTA